MLRVLNLKVTCSTIFSRLHAQVVPRFRTYRNVSGPITWPRRGRAQSDSPPVAIFHVTICHWSSFGSTEIQNIHRAACWEPSLRQRNRKVFDGTYVRAGGLGDAVKLKFVCASLRAFWQSDVLTPIRIETFVGILFT
eukprot:Selendium_serpulae@DN6340_c1_g1_i2.p1